MATDLNDLVESLKREVAVPGTFSTVYRNTSDADLVGSLMDAFGAAQIDGFFLSQTLDPDAETVTPDLSTAGKAVVVIYAAERILTMQVMGLRQRSLYEAGPVKYETENSASVLTQILKSMSQRKLGIVASVESYLRVGLFSMRDLYAERVTGVDLALGGPDFYPYELVG